MSRHCAKARTNTELWQTSPMIGRHALADGVCLYISPSCERISGYTAEQFLADENLILKIAHLDDEAKVSEHFGKLGHPCHEEDIQLDFRIVSLPERKVRRISDHCMAGI